MEDFEVPEFDPDAVSVPLTPDKFSTQLKRFLSSSSRKTALLLVRSLVFLVIRAWVVFLLGIIRQIPVVGALTGPRYNTITSGANMFRKDVEIYKFAIQTYLDEESINKLNKDQLNDRYTLIIGWISGNYNTNIRLAKAYAVLEYLNEHSSQGDNFNELRGWLVEYTDSIVKSNGKTKIIPPATSYAESLILNAIDGFFKFFNRFFKLNKTIYGVVSPVIASLVMLLLSYVKMELDGVKIPNPIYDVGAPGDSSATILAKKSVHAAIMALSLIVTQYIVRTVLGEFKEPRGERGFGLRKSRRSRKSRSVPGRGSTRVSRKPRKSRKSRKSRKPRGVPGRH